MKRELVIVGAGGFAAEMIESAIGSGWRVRGLYDDAVAAKGRTVIGCQCIGRTADFEQSGRSNYIIAIGNNRVREQLSRQFDAAGHDAVAIVHPSAVVSPTARLEPGCFVGAGAFVGPLTLIGRHAIVNFMASVGHDSSVGPWSQLCPGTRVSGGVSIGEGFFAGSNSVLAPGIRVGAWSRLGALAFANGDLPANCIAVGVPAKVHSTAHDS